MKFFDDLDLSDIENEEQEYEDEETNIDYKVETHSLETHMTAFEYDPARLRKLGSIKRNCKFY